MSVRLVSIVSTVHNGPFPKAIKRNENKMLRAKPKEQKKPQTENEMTKPNNTFETENEMKTTPNARM